MDSISWGNPLRSIPGDERVISQELMQSAVSFLPDVDFKRARDVRVVVITGNGFNCEDETTTGFRLAGADAQQVHISQLAAHPKSAFDGVKIIAFVGGFSFGDHVAGGRLAANRLRFVLGESIARFVDDGGFALGMCNGFQVMAKLGLLPALDRKAGEPLAEQSVSLIANERLGYRDAWVKLVADAKSPCVFTRGISTIDVPSRHGEGRFVFRDEATYESLRQKNLFPVFYADDSGNPTEAWPANPNGSRAGVAGLCDVSGRVFGLMPHPEAFLYAENHPDFVRTRREDGFVPMGAGLRLLANGVKAAIEA